MEYCFLKRKLSSLNSNWLNNKTTTENRFLYYLEWKNAPKLKAKVGYKFSKSAFKKDFGRPHHLPPKSCTIWQLHILDIVDSRDKWIQTFEILESLKSSEKNIHRKLKATNHFSPLIGTREFYTESDIDVGVTIIENELIKISGNKIYSAPGD